MIRLPIDEVLSDVVSAVRDRASLVLQAPTGAGKTTRVPPALLDVAGGKRVVMLEPRRIAARAAAARIAEERGWRLGGEVGFHVRMERRASAATRLLVVTEGLLVRMLQDDPFLDDVGVVILDEFHERSLHADLALAMCRRVQREARPDLRIVVMSATLDATPVAEWLGAAVVTSEGRSFPVETSYLRYPDPRPVHEQVADAVRAVAGPGGVLAFLPGMAEIRRTAAALGDVGVPVQVLHGDLPMAEQDAVLRFGGPRVVLATNVAETSLTLPGIVAVVDSGLARVMRQDPATGLDRLELARIGRASADQRAGRAGREAPGRCVRLWTEREHAALRDRDDPEIRRVDLAGPVLELSAWGERDVEAFPWFEAPPPHAIANARRLLEDLGALGPPGVTPLGRAMVRLPVHPRLARMLVEAHRLGHPDAGAKVAALLSERDPFRPVGPAAHRSRSDVLDRLERLESSRDEGRGVRRVADRLAELVSRELGAPGARIDRDEAVRRAVLAGWPDRVARRREPGGARGVMVGGRGVRQDDRSAVDAPLFVCVDVDASAGEAVVRLASEVDASWLDVETGVDVGFDPQAERVSAVRRRRYRDLVLDEAPAPVPDREAAAGALAEAAARDPAGALGLDREEVASLLARWRFLAGAMPDLDLPPADEAVQDVIPDLCRGRRSFDELRRAPVREALEARLSWRQREALDREAPERIEVPSGSRIRLQYEPGRPPVLAVRIQELFGLAETPRVAGGRVRVVLHLLAPNQRPQQVTDDLASFWRTTWPEVRKELRARYPKHAWPEDPWTAPPQRGPKRR